MSTRNDVRAGAPGLGTERTNRVRRSLLSAALVALLMVPCLPARAEGPRRAEQMLADARSLLERGDEARALTKVEQAAELAPDWPAPHASLGLLHQRRSNEALARRHFARFQLLGLLSTGAEDCDLTRRIAEGEALMIYLTNAERARRGLPPVTPHSKLARVARDHCREMARLDYFSHLSPTASRRTAADRFRQVFGFPPVCIAENLARMTSRPFRAFNFENLHDSHERLMESTTHRHAILWDRPTHIGVGIVVNDLGDYWIAEEFVCFEP